MLESMILSAFITIFTEIAVAFLLGVRGEDDLGTIAWINIVTNPIATGTTYLILFLTANFVLTNAAVAILEIAVVATEGFLFRKYLKTLRWNPFLFSLILNASSFGAGILVNLVWG